MDLEDARSDLINDLLKAEARKEDYMLASVAGLRVILQELARLEHDIDRAMANHVADLNA